MDKSVSPMEATLYQVFSSLYVGAIFGMLSYFLFSRLAEDCIAINLFVYFVVILLTIFNTEQRLVINTQQRLAIYNL
jgi:hypothetical protein